MPRTPTQDDYLAFDGAHCDKLWRGLPEWWRCPGCRRTKFEVLRWVRRRPKRIIDGQVVQQDFMGWLAAFHRHHDHGAGCSVYHPDYVLFARFPRTVICDQCNSADGLAKRHLGLPADWSFAPSEIGEFVTAMPHGQHVIDYAAAKRIYEHRRDAA